MCSLARCIEVWEPVIDNSVMEGKRGGEGG